MSGWLVPREDLTEEQLHIVELSAHENRLIQGGPGSGKTIVLLHRARYLSDIYNIPQEKFHIFVFTRSLKQYIKSALDYLNLSDSCVSTVDSWCYHFFKANISNRVPKSSTGFGTDYAEIRLQVYNYLRRNPKHQKCFEFIMVDEAQDLEEISLSILNLISNHLTVFYDHKQQIYAHGSEEKEIKKCIEANSKNISLLSVYRCSPYIVNIASKFINDRSDKEMFFRQTKIAQLERETPLFYKATDHNDEKERMVQAIKTRLAKGERIAVLFPQKRQVFGYAKAFKGLGMEVEVPPKQKSSDYISHNFFSERPKLMPYHSAKGLTFDTVFLPRLQNNSFYHSDINTIRNLIFVGITRAITWVFMSSVDNQPFSLESYLYDLQEAGHLRIETNSNGQRNASDTQTDNHILFNENNQHDDLFDDLL